VEVTSPNWVGGKLVGRAYTELEKAARAAWVNERIRELAGDRGVNPGRFETPELRRQVEAFEDEWVALTGKPRRTHTFRKGRHPKDAALWAAVEAAEPAEKGGKHNG
jgi:hypothetical protein